MISISVLLNLPFA